MKNIFLIPTDKPSRLCIDNSCNELNYSEIEGLSSKHITNQYIYITSDEEIKEGDWYLDTFNNQKIKANKYSDHKYYGNACKKIILTTDQDLMSKTCVHNFVNVINDGFQCTKCKKHVLRSKITISDTTDGVQAIDDKFLEWFIKNPTCEFVEIDFSLVSGSFKYKIIIPKEEPKKS